MSADEKYMQRCLDLALLGMGAVSPNPLVGAVIVWKDKIIGEGYHQQYGHAHAEVNAINSVFEKFTDAGLLLKQSTLYVNLEPCAHQGKTPPCADLIIRHEIPFVVTGSHDPSDAVNGKGIQKLRDAGVHVRENVLQADSDFLNRRFFTRIKKQRPYIILKWAQTADFFFAPEQQAQKWISSKEARILTHKWRAEEDAVLVGKNTAMTDNPRLNVREWKGRNPRRIVIDKNLELGSELNIFDQSQETIIFNALKTETLGSLKYISVENFDHYLPQMLLYQLYLMDIQSLIIEGGARTLELFIKAGLWDEARVFTGGQKWHLGLKAPFLEAPPAEEHRVGTDRLEFFYNTSRLSP